MQLGVRSLKNCFCSYDKSLYFGSEGKDFSISGNTALNTSAQNLFASSDHSILSFLDSFSASSADIFPPLSSLSFFSPD